MSATPKPDRAVFLPGPQVCARYQRSDMTIHRWLNDPELNFPRPTYFGRYRYWRIDELERWEVEQARKPNGRYSRSSSYFDAEAAEEDAMRKRRAMEAKAVERDDTEAA